MKILLPALLGAAHALNDFFSGYLLAVFSKNFSVNTTTEMLLLYGALAFGGQIPVGLWLNKHANLKLAVFLAIILLILGATLSHTNYSILTLVVVGIASALLHVAGGTWILNIAPDRAGITGIFVAPGVAGLALGGVLGSQGMSNIPIFTIAIAFILLVAIWMAAQKYLTNYNAVTSQISPEFEAHDAIMLIVLAAICLRSLLWDIINIYYVGRNYSLLLALGFSAFSGKIIGGFISDALGWKRWLLISLPLSTLLLGFFGSNAIVLCAGVALLQSTTPMMVKLMHNAFPGEPSIAIALSLGLGILLAGIPTFLPFFRENAYLVLISLCVAIPLYGWWVVRRLQ
jgi:FSR family fosmidomycin resistance protein-like MFS transporter